MKITALSDMHGYLPPVKEFDKCDVVCICGDIVPLDYQDDTYKSISWFLLDFRPWAESLPCDKVIFVAGNHDFFLQDLHKKLRAEYAVNDEIYREVVWRSPAEVMKKLLVGTHKGESKLVYLCDNSYEYEGVRFYGTPWIADLSKWAFYQDADTLKLKYGMIPKKCDVLLTHMPPKLNDAGLVREHGYNWLSDFGSEALADAIREREIKYAICGHVHSGNHRPADCDGTQVVNVSLKDEMYKRAYSLFTFDV